MTKVSFFIHGIYPRSEKLIQVSRDFDRKRASVSDLKNQQKKNRRKLINFQKKLKIQLIEDGKLNWQDIFRPFAENSSGIKLGSLTRHFDNNTFFRQPVIIGRVKFDRKKILKYCLNIKNVSKITLPSFFYFSKIAENQYYKNWQSLLFDLASEFRKLVKDLEKSGFDFIQFNDPYIVYHPINQKEIQTFKKALIQFKKDLKVKIDLHTFFGDGSKIFKTLVNFPVDAIGFDFFKTSLEDLPKQKLNKAIICGCLNGRSPVIENKKAVINFVNKLITKLNPPEIYLTSNCDLEFLTANLAYKKLELLAKVIDAFPSS